MISKILITLGVIVACMWFLSARAAKPELRTIRNPADERRRKVLRNAAFAFMAVMIVAAGIMIYLELDSRNAVVTVRVINTQSGEVKSYRAEKSAIRGDGFTTVDGVQVFVAGIERIEIDASK